MPRQVRHRIAATLRRTQRWRVWTVPSWLMSVCVHWMLIVAIVWWGRNWRPPPVGFGGTALADSGVTFITDGLGTGGGMPGTNGGAPGEPPPGPGDDPQPGDAEGGADAALASVQSVAAPLSVSTQLPSPGPSAAAVTAPMSIGAGGAPFATVVSDARELIKSGIGPGRGGGGTGAGGGGGNGGTGGPGGAGGGLPGAGFMGTNDRGSRIVYVIDCSSSMANYGAMRAAKAALVASLQTLSDVQQFQIIFYNQAPKPMKVRTGNGTELLFATEVNKALARQYISGQEPDLGTDHMPALKLALKIGPEVIFFLTDAQDPQLSSGELDEIRRLNQGRTRIHAIEFGKGPQLSDDAVNFLVKLAQQNGGTHRYYDVKRFANQ